MSLFEELKWRGLVKDVTNEKNIVEKLEKPTTMYCGFDPTGDSLHVGHLIPLLLLRRFQIAGHHAIAVAGGGTGMIGDPSGRQSERQLLDANQINHNVEAIKSQLSAFIDFEGDNPAIIVNNYDWLSKIDLISFLRDYGKHFSINYMLAKDVVASRLETGISFTEFSYMILQSIDYLHLYQNNGCTIQFGGSDQWGNLTAGCELIRRVTGNENNAEAFTLPLITSSDGVKFGKSSGAAVWLDPKRTSPYEFYQFWINTPDADVEHYLKVFTFLTKQEIKDVVAKHNENPGTRFGQKTLAEHLTKLVHHKQGLEDALKITEVLFSGDIAELSYEEVSSCFKGVPTATSDNADLNVLDALVLSKAASSKREAREFVSGGSITINGKKCTDLEFVISKDNAFGSKLTIIRRGKKKYVAIEHI